MPASVRPDLTLMEGLRAIPPAVARHHRVIPFRYEGDCLIAGARNDNDPRVLDALRRLGHRDARLEVASPELLHDVLSSWYGPTADVAEFVGRLSGMDPDEAVAPLEAEDPIEQSPAVRYVELILEAAWAERASDIHIQPDPVRPRTRFRIDGILVERPAPPAWLAGRVVARIKALAGLALGECLFAQDGQILLDRAEGPLSMRVSVLPSDRGECVVLRLLTIEGQIPKLTELGAPEDARQKLLSAASALEGIIVFAGPTGSGKTTTLHSLLTMVDCERRNVVSIEEPVEIQSDRIRQVPVRRETGLDFAGALRVVLRQDPDVILVGETRDRETAQLVVEAALAGHLVLTTVHAAGAISAFDRFGQLGADTALLAEAARLMVSQRLVRRICDQCGGNSCFMCEGTGLRARIGIFEVLDVDTRLKRMVREGASAERLLEAATEAGFEPLLSIASRLVESGVTLSGEVERVLGEELRPRTVA